MLSVTSKGKGNIFLSLYGAILQIIFKKREMIIIFSLTLVWHQKPTPWLLAHAQYSHPVCESPDRASSRRLLIVWWMPKWNQKKVDLRVTGYGPPKISKYIVLSLIRDRHSYVLCCFICFESLNVDISRCAFKQERVRCEFEKKVKKDLNFGLCSNNNWAEMRFDENVLSEPWWLNRTKTTWSKKGQSA